jgi:hypothetical protein
MEKLDLTNKVSPCCKKKIKYHEIAHTDSRLGFDYYTCSYCEGRLTRTQVLRANIPNDCFNKVVLTTDNEFNLTKIEERLEKLESKFKVNKYTELAKIRTYITEELDKFDNKKVQFNDRYRIQIELMQMVQELVRKLEND